MQLQFLITSEQRASGAMFMESLNDTVLAFIYPTDGRRTFHTFFCPPMRIIALNAEGQVVFDEVITKWRWVKLPVCRYVIETGPKVDYRPYLQTVLSVAPDLPQQGSMDPSVRMDSLLFALLAEAVADMRRIRDAHRGEVRPDIQRHRFEAWERGQIVSSAGFILDFSRAWHLPDGAVKLSYSVLKAEEPYLDEIVAASVAGIPWRHEFPNHCIRCGKSASWRPILNPAPNAPVEILWRYQRPENAIPICHHCTETLNLLRDESLQLDLVWGLWGPRFEAFWGWHRAMKNNRLPKEWDMYTHPLWPADFGGEAWETGSGALKFAEPRPPHQVIRDEQHMRALRRGLFTKKFRGRQPGETPLQKLLDFRLDIHKENLDDLFAFLGALSLSVLAFELLNVFQSAFSTFGGNRLMNFQSQTPIKRRSTWEALLIAILPGRFDPDQAKNMSDVISLLRRAGYPYDTPGEFYAVAIRDFSTFLLVGGMLAGALAAMNIIAAAPVIAMIFILLGLRRPYVRLKTLAKKRADSLRNNMLIGLSVLGSLLSSGVGVQEALRRASTVGGPFCNLLGLLVARMEVEDFTKAIDVTRAHLPDPKDVEANLFLRDIYDFFANNRPVLSSVQGLQESVHRSVVESTEERAALVRQRAGLFGVMAVLGLVLAIIAPFMGSGLM